MPVRESLIVITSYFFDEAIMHHELIIHQQKVPDVPKRLESAVPPGPLHDILNSLKTQISALPQYDPASSRISCT
jgi:hypothetical protein